MIWSKQFYHYDVPEWLQGDPTQPPPPPERKHGRNRDWTHLNNADIISMPDKWEYPWYAAWDLAFHCIPLAVIDAEFAKGPARAADARVVHAPERPVAGLRVGVRRRESAGACLGGVAGVSDRSQATPRVGSGRPGDLAFLERVFHKLMLNFTWWVNRKDAQGRNIFQGGFLGLDNIGCFDRSSAAAHGRLHQPGRRHELDGDVLPEPDAHRARTGRCTIPSMRTSPRSSSSTSSPSPAPSTTWATTRWVCGTKRTSSTTTISACRTGKICR